MGVIRGGGLLIFRTERGRSEEGGRGEVPKLLVWFGGSLVVVVHAADRGLFDLDLACWPAASRSTCVEFRYGLQVGLSGSRGGLFSVCPAPAHRRDACSDGRSRGPDMSTGAPICRF